MASAKMSSVPSWHQYTAEKKPLKKHKLGPPDVYPLDSKTEEENLSTQRILKGWHFPASNFEHESLVYHGREQKLGRLDECLYKSASLVCGAFNKKFEINATLDKDRKKMGKETSIAVQASVQAGIAKAKERASFFTDLARGKPFIQLAKKVPGFNKRKEEILEYLWDYRIPTYRALWFLKITATYFTAQAKSSKKTPDSFEKDYRGMFRQEITNLMRKMWQKDDLTASNIYKDRWAYMTTLARRAFDEGVIEKQEFLNDLCQDFCDFYITRSSPHLWDSRETKEVQFHEEKPALLRVFLLLFSHFMRYINLNMILARRTAHMFATKLRMMLMEYNDLHPGDPFYQTVQQESGENQTATVVINSFHKMAGCKANRSNIYLMSAMLHNIVIEAPAAVIWNNYKVAIDRVPFIISQLCSSPLDLLPCPVYELPMPPGKEAEKFVEVLKLRHQEIVRRSQAVQDRWSFNQKEQTIYAQKIDRCLDVIGILDSANVFDPEYIPKLADSLFIFKSENYNADIILRLRLIFHWAVTVEREGAYRQCVVAKLLQYHGRRCSYYFGELHIQDAILDYFFTEAPKPGSKFYGPEFGSLMTLFLELMRYRLFDHDWFVKYMIRNNEHECRIPVLPDGYKNTGQGNINTSIKTEHESENGHNGLKTEASTTANPMATSLIIPPVDRPDDHILTTEEMWGKHRILIQVPLPQTEAYRDEANQREMVVHGTGTAAEAHKTELKKIAKEICKIWQKKIYIKFIKLKDDTERLWCPKRYTAQKVQETLSKFRTQTYYDQVVICGWCSESFVDMLHDFISGKSLQMPTSDGLDILLGMLEESQYIFGIFEICEAILPMLPMVEKVIRSLAADCIPGTMACQIGYVFVSFLSKHWHYFLHCGRAPIICNMLYNLIERMMRAQDYPATSWGRVIAAFVYHTKKQLKKSHLTSDIKIHGSHSEFRNVFNHGTSSTCSNVKYNTLFCRDILESTSQELRYYSYHKYKKRLPSFGIVSNRYSFVINSFIAAKNCGRDFDRLADLSSFCGHISAQIPAMADEWITAVRAICLKGQHSYVELLQELNISDCSTHYPLATFVMLLAGKYAFSVPRLIADLLNNVFSVMWKKDYYYGGSGVIDVEPGVCLALLIIGDICCASDQPFAMSVHYTGSEERTKLVPSTADERVLSMIHWCEMDNALFPLLCNIGILQDSLKGRHKELDAHLPLVLENTFYRKEYLTNIVRATLSMICEQDWVTLKMFDIVQSNNMEAFNHDRLKQNGLGQQLLRLGIRRRCEKDILKDLTVCNGNSKKALIDKLLVSMNLWNLRATLFDLMLMIKEISPEGTQRHQQQGAIAADALVGEIGRCCRDLFTTAYKEGTRLPNAILDGSFRISHVSNYWLIAPLIRLCPRPSNLPPTFNVSVAGKFLGEAARLLDTANDSSKERIHQSTWLLSQQSFLNLIMICMKAEKNQDKGAKELLVDSLYKQLQEITIKTKANPSLPHLEKFSADKEGLLLRLSLVGGIFDQICRAEMSEPWAILLFQTMLHGIISPDKDNRCRILFDSCYDMLSTLMLWTLVDVNNQATHDTDNGEKKYRWGQYTGIIKKLKKEVNETRISGDLRHLYQFLPIPKNVFDVIAMEPCGNPPQPNVKPNKHAPHNQLHHGVRHGRLALQPHEKHKVNSYDFIHGYVPDASSIRSGWKWSYFQAVKVDKQPVPIQKFVAKMALHKHPGEFVRPAMICTDAAQDQFLTPPVVEPTEVTTPTTSAPSSSSATSTTTTTAPTTSTTVNGSSTIGDSPASVEVATPPSRPDSRPASKDATEEVTTESRLVGSQSQDTTSQQTNITSTSGMPMPPLPVVPPLPPLNNQYPQQLAPQASHMQQNQLEAANTPELRPSSSGNVSGSGSPKRSRKRQNLTKQPSQTKKQRSNSRAENVPQAPPPYSQPWQNPSVAAAPLPSASQSGPTYPTSMSSHQPLQPPTNSISSASAANASARGGGEFTKEKFHDFVQKRMEAKEQQQMSTGSGMAAPPNAIPSNHGMSAAHHDFGRGAMQGGSDPSGQPFGNTQSQPTGQPNSRTMSGGPQPSMPQPSLATSQSGLQHPTGMMSQQSSQLQSHQSMSSQHQQLMGQASGMQGQHQQSMHTPHQSTLQSQQMQSQQQAPNQPPMQMQNQHAHLQQHQSSMSSHQGPSQPPSNMISAAGQQNGSNFGLGIQPRNQMGQFSSSKDDPRGITNVPGQHISQNSQSHSQSMGMQSRPDVGKPISQNQTQMSSSQNQYSAQPNQPPSMGGPINSSMTGSMTSSMGQSSQPSMRTQSIAPHQMLPQHMQSQMQSQSMQLSKPSGMNQPGQMTGVHNMSMQPSNSTYGQQSGMPSQSQGMQNQPPGMHRQQMSQPPMMGGQPSVSMNSHGAPSHQSTVSTGYPHHQQPHSGMPGGSQPHMQMQPGMSSMHPQHGMSSASQMPQHMSSMSSTAHQTSSYMGGQDKHMSQPPLATGSSQNMMSKQMMNAPPMGQSYGGPSGPSYTHGQPPFQQGPAQMGGVPQAPYGGPMTQNYSAAMSHGVGPPMNSRMPNGMMNGPNVVGGPGMAGQNMGGPPIGGPGMAMPPQFGQPQYMMNDPQRMMSQQQQSHYGHQTHNYNQPPQY